MKITDELTSIPFDDLYETYYQDSKLQLKQWVDCYCLKGRLVSYLPKMLRFLTRGFLQQPELNEYLLNKIYDFNNSWHRGLYLFLQYDHRSEWLQLQTKQPSVGFSALVPLQLLAFKQKFSIPYSSWPVTLIPKFVNPKLAKAMLCEPNNISKDLILEMRSRGLVYRTGTKVGESRDPQATHKLYNLPLNEFSELPELAQVMLAQIWCAHPQTRHQNMILDPKNWDLVPEPLVNAEVLVGSEAKESKVLKEKLPWE